MKRSELRVMVLDDEDIVNDLVVKIFKRTGITNIDSAFNEKEALDLFKLGKYDLLFSDTYMGEDAYGPRVLKKARELGQDPKVIASSSNPKAVELWTGESKPDYFIVKPFGNIMDLVNIVKKEFPEA